MRYGLLAALLILASCQTKGGLTRKQKEKIEDRNEALLTQHNEIWDLMGLSQPAKDELNGMVTGVNSQLMKNEMKGSRKFEAAKGVKRAGTVTHDSYIASHKKRFDMLEITASTQKELLAAAEFVWTALHDRDADLTDEQKKTAGIIQEMMGKLGGPPP